MENRERSGRRSQHRRVAVLVALLCAAAVAASFGLLLPSRSSDVVDDNPPLQREFATQQQQQLSDDIIRHVTDVVGKSNINQRPTDNNEPVYLSLEDSLACSVLQPSANVSTKLGDFQLCFDARSCRGSLTFSHTDPAICYQRVRPLSRNATLDKELRALGPDQFRYRLEGPQTVAGTAEHLGQCKYQIVFPSLGLPGSYRLGLEWLYADYYAQDELTNHWPPLLKQSLLPVDETFSTNYHLQQCTLPSTTTVRCAPGTQKTLGAGAERKERPSDELCSGLERDTSGRWEVEDTKAAAPMVFTRVRVKKLQKHPIVFQWALQHDVARHWRPHACRLRHGHAVDVVLPRLRERAPRVVVGGDSQLRALYFGLANVLNGHEVDCVRNITTVAAEPRHCIENVKGSQRKKIGGVQLDFVDDLFLDRFAGSERYAGYSVVIVGFAQHPASKEHWSFDRYRASFVAKLRKAMTLKKAGAQVIWYLAPQYPHTTHGFPVFVRDWRTDVRLRLFNQYAKEACLAHNIPVVDAFAISTPYSHTSPDQAHFTNFVSYELVYMTLGVVSKQLS